MFILCKACQREKTLKGKRKCKPPLTAIKSEEKRSVKAGKVFRQNFHFGLYRLRSA